MAHTRKAIDPGSIQTVSQWQGHNLVPTLTILPDIVIVRGRLQGPKCYLMESEYGLCNSPDKCITMKF